MDPWLELYWRDVHASLIIYIRNQLQRQLPEPLVARAAQKGILHKNTAARKISRLTKRVKALAG